MKVLVVRAKERPTTEEVETLKDMQNLVGGHIQAVYPWEEKVALVCNEEGLLLNLEPNSVVPRYGWIYGTFFICGLGEEDFISLTDEQLERFSQMFEF